MKLHWFGKKTTNELGFNERKELRKAYFRQAREICGSIDYNGFYSIDDEKDFRYGALGDCAMRKLNDLITDLTKIRDRIIELEEKDKNDGCDL